MNSNYAINMILKAKDEASKVLNNLKGQMQGVEKQTVSFNQKIKNLQPAFQNMATYGGAATIAIASLGTMAVKKASELQDLRIELNTLTGSAEKGGKMFSQVLKDAAKTPFESSDLVKAQSTMLQFGVAQDKVRESMMMLGDISGGNANKLQSLALVFGQINAAGKLTGQDLLQLINLGFNPLKEISENTGESMESLREKMSDGAISFDMVKDSMQRATSEGGLFYGMMEVKSQTFSGVLSTLRDNVGIALASLGGFANGEVVEGGLLDTLTKAVNTLIPYLEKISQRAAENPIMAKNIFLVVGATAALVTGIGFLGLAVPAIVTGMGLLTFSITAFGVSTTVALGPVAILTAAIGFLTKTIIDNWSVFADQFKAWGDLISTYAGVVKTKTETLWMQMGNGTRDGLQALGYYWDAFTTILQTLWMNIQNNAQEILVRGLLGILTMGMSEILISWGGGWENVKNKTFEIVEPMVDWISKQVDRVIGFVNTLRKLRSEAKSLVSSVVGGGGVDGARANGGPVSSGKTYLVGERGPELFTPSGNGNIVPNHKLGGGVNISLSVGNINNTTDLQSFKKMVEDTVIDAISNNQLGYV